MKASVNRFVLLFLAILTLQGCALYLEQAVKDVISEPMTCGKAVCKGTAVFYRVHERLPSSQGEFKVFCERIEDPDLDIDWSACSDFTFKKLDDGRIKVYFMYLKTNDAGTKLEFSFTETFDHSKTSW